MTSTAAVIHPFSIEQMRGAFSHDLKTCAGHSVFTGGMHVFTFSDKTGKIIAKNVYVMDAKEVMMTEVHYRDGHERADMRMHYVAQR